MSIGQINGSLLERRPEESKLDYHKRIINGKLVDKTLADYDYKLLSNLIYGRPYAGDVARRMFYGSKRTLDLIEKEGLKFADGNILSDMDNKIIELRKEKQKFFDQRNALSKLIRERSRQEELNEILINTITKSNLPKLNYQPSEIEESDNDLLVSLNDIHFGAFHNNFWGVYNSDVCREMMKKYLDKIIHIAEMHKSENCILWENGDAISGSIHKTIQITNKENVIQQLIGVSELIAEFIAELSKHFKTVRFVSVSGNHSRIDANKEDSLVEERLDDLIEWYLTARLQNFANVKIGDCEKIDPTMYIVNVRGLDYCGVHGDFDCTDSKVQSVQTMARRPIYAILSGHKHHNKIDEVQGIKTVMAGSFLGVDSYCVQKRIFGHREQLVSVCDSDGIVCNYDIRF